jgi:hypothetical protein
MRHHQGATIGKWVFRELSAQTFNGAFRKGTKVQLVSAVSL